MSSSPSTWFLAACRSQETAEKHVSAQPTGGFVIWPSPTLKGCLILSTKQESGHIQHIEIYKKPDGFKMKGQPRFYSSLEMLILSLRKESKKGEEAASEDHAPKKSPRPERRAEGGGNGPSGVKGSMTPKSPRIQALQGKAAGAVPADERVISEMSELFPGTSREKIVRATTLAAGDREKAMDLLLSQSIDSQQAKNQKVESLGKVLKDVIEQSRASLVALAKVAQSVRDATTLKSAPVQAFVRAFSTIKKLMINIPGPSMQSPRPVGPSSTAQLAAFAEEHKQNNKLILAKLQYIENEIDKKSSTVKKLVEMGGVVKQVREQLTVAEEATATMLFKEEEKEKGKEKDKDGTPDSPAQGARNYVIPYADIEIEKEIGKGAYGKVYKATYDGREVAVKSMALLKDERERNWMKREISLLKQVRHPNVTEFIGISKDPENNLLIVMEFVPGGELYPLLQKEDLEIDWPLRLKIALDVASALAFMHARNIIHRDIKSENLLVDSNWNIKLCDFGFARAIESREKTRMTMCGSPYFNAPELLLGKAYNEKADVFAFGILLCEVITRAEVNLDRLGRKEINAYALDLDGLRQKVPKDCPGPFWKLAVCCVNYEPEKVI